MNKLKNNKAITLIALVITIIVMLVLVAVTINIATNGGLFDYAGKAARGTKEEKQAEQDWVTLDSGMSSDELIAKYTSNKKEDLAKLKQYFEGNLVEEVLEDELGPPFINNDIIPDARTSIQFIYSIDGSEDTYYYILIQYHNNYYKILVRCEYIIEEDIETERFETVYEYELSDLDKLKIYFIGKLKSQLKENGAYKNEAIIPDASTSIVELGIQNAIKYNNNRYILTFVNAEHIANEIGEQPQVCSDVTLIENIIDVTNSEIIGNNGKIQVGVGGSTTLNIRDYIANAIYIEDFYIESSDTNKVVLIENEEKVTVNNLLENEEITITLVGKTSGKTLNVTIIGYLPMYS